MPTTEKTTTAPARPEKDRKLGLERRFTVEGVDPYDKIEWDIRTALIGSPDKPVFEQAGVEFPASWSQNATNIVAQKYFAYGLGDPNREYSVKQMIDRVVEKIATEGEKAGYFGEGERDIFAQELRHILVNQMASFNSPVWFNIGVDGAPQTSSACFILSVEDTLRSIGNWYTEEMRIFQAGSGAGINLSRLRASGERLSRGGASSGPVTFMRAADASAGTIQSGGVTRRAAKMVILDADHPDIEDFVTVKSREEERIRALAKAGFDMGFGPTGERNLAESTAYQNANQSVRVTDEFMRAAESGGKWELKGRKDDSVNREIDARELLQTIAEAAWRCADPGLQYETTIADWHTTPAQGEISASNPCCFVGETLVDTSEGKIPFAEIKRMSDAGVPLPYAFSFDLESGLPVLRRITKAWEAGQTKDLVEVRTQRGLVLYCTPEHPFLTREGKYVTALNLEPGTRLRKIGRWTNEKRSGRSYLNHKVTDAAPNGTSNQARWMWDQVFGRIPAGMDVHHRNEDATDDRLSNFELRESRQHKSDHSSGGDNPRFIEIPAHALVEVWEAIERLPRQRPGRPVTPNRWNAYVRREGLLGTIPVAASPSRGGRIQGKTWDEFEAWIEEQRALVNDRVKSVTWIELDQPVPVYDLEVEGVHNFAVCNEGCENPHSVIVHNSEYLSNDNSACNLASLNLLKFLRPDGSFDIESFRHVARIVFLAQEITISFADFPTPKIAKNTRELRQIGIGYANLGALLMALGLPYDSDDGRNYAAATTSLLTGESYAMSTEIARKVGPFAHYEANADSMQRVLAKHRDAAEDIRVSDPRATPIVLAAQESWDRVIEQCAESGIRNAQASVLAPTGTISFMMDCDTTGIEPDFSLVKHKTLVGGGSMTIINRTIPQALKNLGYTPEQVEEIVAYVSELVDQGDGVKAPRGQMVGAPHLAEDHLAVFDCALGERSIAPMGHVKMMAAAQPFLSGAISKTVNLPADATVEDIVEVFMEGWKGGLKALAVYRDGSKNSQPLAEKKGDRDPEAEKAAEQALTSLLGDGLLRGERREIPREAEVVGVNFTVGQVGGYIHVRLFDDGTPGAVFVDVGQAGSTLHGFIRAWAVTMSLALQHGTPLDMIISKLAWTQFEPAGFTDDSDIRTARSIVDYVVRWMGNKFLDLDEISRSQLGLKPLESKATDDESEDSAPIPGGEIAPRRDVHAATRPAAERPKLEMAKPSAVCTGCGSGNLQRTGSCYTCMNCGTTTGCG